MAFQLARRMSAVMLMVPACPEFGFLGRPGPVHYSARVGRRRLSARPAQSRPTYSARYVLTSPVSPSSPMSCGIGRRPPPSRPKN